MGGMGGAFDQEEGTAVWGTEGGAMGRLQPPVYTAPGLL